jgi:iron complex outermembrane receptor protein
LLALTGFLLLSGMALAADIPLPSEEDFVAELPVVLSATRLSQPQSEAPAAVTVIDRQMIQASGARNLSEVFRLVPGFLVAFDNGHNHIVTYHGLSDAYSRRLQVLIDGRSVYLPSFGGVAWTDLPLMLEDIERIEVIRGPNAASYGANSFLAIINITTRHAAAEPGSYVRVNAGSNDVRDGMLRTAGGDQNAQYRLTVGYQQDSGYAHQFYDSSNITLINGRIDWRAGENNELQFQYGYSGSTHGNGESGAPFDSIRDERATSRFEQLGWRHRFNSDNDLAIQLYHTHHEWNDRYQSLTVPVLNLDLSAASDRYDVDLQQTLGISETMRLVWGAGARLDESQSLAYLGTTKSLSSSLYRLFGSLEWRLTPNWIVNTGLMYEQYEITGGDMSPRLAVNYHLTRDHTLRASYSGASRQPVVFEESSNARLCLSAPPGCFPFDQLYQSSGGLKPEHIDSGEIGYLGLLSPALSLDMRLFHDRIYDLIGVYHRPYADIDGNVGDFRNGGKAALQGSELQMQYQPSRESRVILGMANVQIESNNYDKYQYSKSAPRNSLSLLAMQQFETDWQLSGAYYWHDEVKFLSGVADPYNLKRLDVRLARKTHFADASGEVALVMQNLLGDKPTYRNDGISPVVAFVTMSMRFR